MRVRGRGFTLIETIVAAGLFVVLGLIAYTIFKYAMIAHNRGLIGTDAQHSVRELINRMSADLQSSMALQISAISDTPVQSAVLYPSTEGAQAVDDLIFTAPAVQNLGTLDASNPVNYLLVRYAVHLHDPTKANDPPTAVLRRAYRLDEVFPAYVTCGTTETGVTSTNSHWYVNRAQLDAARGGPGDNSKLGTAANDTPWQEIVTLGGQYDLVTFKVSHRSIANNNLPPYEPFTFSLSATVERYVGTPAMVVRAINPNDANDMKNDRVIKDLTTDVTLQRF